MTMVSDQPSLVDEAEAIIRTSSQNRVTRVPVDAYLIEPDVVDNTGTKPRTVDVEPVSTAVARPVGYA